MAANPRAKTKAVFVLRLLIGFLTRGGDQCFIGLVGNEPIRGLAAPRLETGIRLLRCRTNESICASLVQPQLCQCLLNRNPLRQVGEARLPRPRGSESPRAL